MSKKVNVAKNLKKLILIVENDNSIQSGLISFFEKDYDVICKNNGPDALLYINETRIPDLVLLDMELPGLNGRVFVRRIKFDPKNNKIPVILISSVNSRLIINSFQKLGVVDYIVKPFEQSELVNKIVRIFNMSS
jgi:CheY-like chemotaxis protein